GVGGGRGGRDRLAVDDGTGAGAMVVGADVELALCAGRDDELGLGRRKRWSLAAQAGVLGLELVNAGLSRLRVIDWRGQTPLAAVGLVSRKPAVHDVLHHLMRITVEDGLRDLRVPLRIRP